MSRFFFEKTYLFFQKKNQILNVFLRQISYNLVKKYFHVQTWTKLAMLAWTQLANIGKKTSEIAHLRERFCFHIIKKWRKKIIYGFCVAGLYYNQFPRRLHIVRSTRLEGGVRVLALLETTYKAPIIKNDFPCISFFTHCYAALKTTL